jgi:phosphoribosylformylglycinamidine (FGAM) synthase PurS component
VHGEPESAKALASELSKLGFKDVKPVRRGESVTLT